MVRTVLRARWLAAALLALCLPLVASAQDRGPTCELVTSGDQWYTIYAWDHPENGERGEDCNVGPYGVLTGPNHPAGPGLSILQAGDEPATSFNSVHSYTSETTYVLSDGTTLAGAADRGQADAFAIAGIGNTIEPFPQRIDIIFDTRDLPEAPDDLLITISIEVMSMLSFEEAHVQIDMVVENLAEEDGARGQGTVRVGMRYLWDFAIDDLSGTDTGPLVTTDEGTAYTDETAFVEPDVPEFYSMSSNEAEADYRAVGTVAGPPIYLPTSPLALVFTCAPLAASAPYEFGLSGDSPAVNDPDCSPDPTGDSAVVYIWDELEPVAGRGQPPIGIPVGPGQSTGVRQVIYTESLVQPELCLTLELDATQTSGNLGIPNLQNNDVVCGEDVLEEPNGPIAARGDEDPFELFFDGSDVGITRTIIDGMDIIEDEGFQNGDFARGEKEDPMDVLLSFNIAHSLPELGLVLQADIVRFLADENGPQTAGSFERFFDGSDIGLQSAGENIDAFVFEPFENEMAGRSAPVLGDLYFSTSGNLNIPGLQARDEDIVVCWDYHFALLPTGDIESTCGEIELFFDGSEAGLANASEDVDAFALPGSLLRGFSSAPLYLSTYGNFNVSDVTGRNEDVFACYPAFAVADRGGPLPITSCEAVAIVFDGSDYGLGSNNVFSIDLLEPLPQICGARGPCAAR
jgi:hypothetical protein